MGYPDFWPIVLEKYRKFFLVTQGLGPTIDDLFSVAHAEPFHKVARHLAKMVTNSVGAVLLLGMNGYSLDKNGQVNPADLILDLILSGNAYHNNLNGTWTPFCFSHGLNFGGDPSRETFQGFDPGFPGSLTWPPVCSFPWVLPMPASGAASGSQFQILRDPPTFNQGPFSGSSAPYSTNSIVEGSDSNFYRALTYADADPVSGGSTTWAQFDGDFSDGLEDVRNYCAANGIFISTYINSQKACSDILNEVCEIANCVPVWNGQSLDFYPLSEVSQVGGGVVYTPRTASGPIVVLDSNYFEMDKDEAPVTVKQENMQSVCNILDINYSDAAFDSDGMCGYQAYQSTSVRISDAEHCGLYGPMNGSPRGYDDYICDATTATKVGWPIMKRQRFADTYAVDFKLPQTVGSLLDPMDLITVNDPLFGGVLTTGVATTGPVGQNVRIRELSEDKDGVWTLSCERFMYGMSAPQAPSTAGTVSNPPPSVSAPAGNVNTPYFFEPTAALAVALGMTSEGGLAIAVSGSATNYGGCVVNVSTDGGSSYSAIGRLPGNSTMGYTTADYPLSPNPDASDTLSVDLTESEGELMSYTSGQQAQLIPIALVDNGGTTASGSAAGYHDARHHAADPILCRDWKRLAGQWSADWLPLVARIFEPWNWLTGCDQPNWQHNRIPFGSKRWPQHARDQLASVCRQRYYRDGGGHGCRSESVCQQRTSPVWRCHRPIQDHAGRRRWVEFLYRWHEGSQHPERLGRYARC
ncbi:MAG: hypothetical protein WB558_13280 [Terriglobales bacterium]